MTIELPRRGFLLGLGSLIVAPAIVRAGSLMPVKVYRPGIIIGSNSFLLIKQITRDAVRLFCNSNEFIERIDPNFDIHGITSIRLPTNLRVGTKITIKNNGDTPVTLLGVDVNDLHSR